MSESLSAFYGIKTMNDKSSEGNYRIAVLMLVHKDKNQAQRLIDHLSKDFAVFVHIDKRSNLKIKRSENVFILKKYKLFLEMGNTKINVTN